MIALRELVATDPSRFLAWGGFVLGTVFGFLVQRTQFCAMGSLADIVGFGDYRRWRAWLLASATAIIGTQLLHGYGVVDVAHSMYLSASINWAGNVLGGLLLGIGMVFAGGCPSRNLVRMGAGDLRAGVVLVVMGLFAYISGGGVLGPLRAALERTTAVALAEGKNQSMVTLLAAATAAPPLLLTWVVSGVVAGGLLIYCFAARDFRTSAMHVASGLGVGLCVVAGWALTGLAYDEFAAAPMLPGSLTYVRPTGDTLDYLQRFTASPIPGFGVATVLGAVLGAAVAAVTARRFRLIGFANTSDTLRNLAGAALMGTGGVTALGCTMGQAVTGLSTLALGSLLSAIAIVTGGVLGLRLLEYQISR